MGDKHNDVVIFQYQIITRETLKYIHATMYAHIHDTLMYTHILTKYRARKSFIMSSFILNIQNNIFYYRVISIVQQSNSL